MLYAEEHAVLSDIWDSHGAEPNTDMRRLTTGIGSEKCVVRRFRRRRTSYSVLTQT